MRQAYFQPLGLSELLPRYSFLEGLIGRARVLEVGGVAATGGGSAAYLRDLGARYVLALDPGSDAIAAARRQYASDPKLDFREVRIEDLAEEPFDLLLVNDAAAVIDQPGKLNALIQARSTGGYAVFALRNHSALSLASLAGDEPGRAMAIGEALAVLSRRFQSVELAIQSTLLGYRLAPSRQAELDLQVDGSHSEDEEPAYWLAICGQAPCGVLDTQALAVLPTTPMAPVLGKRAELSERLRFAERDAASARMEADQEKRERASLEIRLAELTDELEAARLSAGDEVSRLRASEVRATSAEGDWRRSAERIAALERDLVAKERELEGMRGLRDSGEELGEARARMLELERKAEVAADEARRLASRAEAERERGLRLERELAAAAGQMESLRQALEAADARAGRLEKDVATVSALERSARQRAEQAELALDALKGKERQSAPAPAGEGEPGPTAAHRDENRGE